MLISVIQNLLVLIWSRLSLHQNRVVCRRHLSSIAKGVRGGRGMHASYGNIHPVSLKRQTKMGFPTASSHSLRALHLCVPDVQVLNRNMIQRNLSLHPEAQYELLFTQPFTIDGSCRSSLLWPEVIMCPVRQICRQCRKKSSKSIHLWQCFIRYPDLALIQVWSKS